MQSTHFMNDVTSAVALGKSVHLAATLHLPDGMDAAGTDLLFVLFELDGVAGPLPGSRRVPNAAHGPKLRLDPARASADP